MSTLSRLARAADQRLHALHQAQAARCFYCDQPVTLRPAGAPATAADATIDHFHPRAEGGANHWRNWVLACAACNNRKASRMPQREEITRWNNLAAHWPHIRSIDLALFESRRCTVCAQWIDPMRLASSLRGGNETRTCRSACGRKSRS